MARKYISFYVVLLLLLNGCKSTQTEETPSMSLHFLDEYIIPEDLEIDSTKVGGLSDLDYDGENFYAIVDLPSSPRIYKLSIAIEDKNIDTIDFADVIEIPHKTGETDSLVFDSEGLVYEKDKDRFILSSEGSISKGKDPFVVTLEKEGNLLNHYKLPPYFKAAQKKGLRNNGAFEGLDKSVDGKGIWVSNELPMKMDGPEVKLYSTNSPVRFTYFDQNTKKPEKQFVYQLGRLRKVPFLPFGMNGVSAIKEYKPGRFLVLERAFSAGHGNHGFRVRLYQVDARQATNTLDEGPLRKKVGKRITPAKKKLVFDFNEVRQQLTNKIVDNLEGIVFGPELENGNPSLILISDNNFSSFTKQLNQVILMEITSE